MIQKIIRMLLAAFVLAMIPMALTESAAEWTFVHVAIAISIIVLMFVSVLLKPSKLERIHSRSR